MRFYYDTVTLTALCNALRYPIPNLFGTIFSDGPIFFLNIYLRTLFRGFFADSFCRPTVCVEKRVIKPVVFV